MVAFSILKVFHNFSMAKNYGFNFLLLDHYTNRIESEKTSLLQFSIQLMTYKCLNRYGFLATHSKNTHCLLYSNKLNLIYF
jgi:hypothetical protein